MSEEKGLWNGKSSHIEHMSYVFATSELVVTFIRGGVYKYLGVPQSVWLTLMNAESVGQTLNTTIKGVYEFERVS